MKRFPYPLKTIRITAYGRSYCPYCQKLKLFLEQLYPNDLSKNYKYYDIDQIIENKQANDLQDFHQKMQPFIGDYNKIPIVFFHGDFYGGFSEFQQIMTQIAKKNIPTKKVKKLLNSLKNEKNLSINEKTSQLLKQLKTQKKNPPLS